MAPREARSGTEVVKILLAIASLLLTRAVVADGRLYRGADLDWLLAKFEVLIRGNEAAR